MWVEFGNTAAIEGYRDAASDDPDLVRWRALGDDGDERITTVVFPDDLPLADCFREAVAACPLHFAEDTSKDNPHGHVKPAWVDSDSEGLKALLAEHFGLTGARQQRRPKTWGKAFGLHENVHLRTTPNDDATGDDEA